MKMISVTDIGDFKLGNAENSEKGTGCTVIICEEGAVGGVDVRGGGPATRETDLLRSENTVNSVNAVVLSGGSAFGLESASGVMRALADMKIGFDVGDDIVVPIVCGASLYDLPIGDNKAFPDVNMGVQAVRNAFAGVFANGNHGAGTGATVGKMKGYDRAMKSGLGTFACGDGIVEVGAIAAVNAVGDIYNGAGNIIAGLRSEDGKSIFGTIKTLKGMVHDNVRPKEDSVSFINKANIQEALAAAAKQYQEEEALAAENQSDEISADEPAATEVVSEAPAEEPVAGFVFETPEGVNEEPAAEIEEAAEEINEEPAAEIEEPAEEIVEEPQEEIAEEPEEEFVHEIPEIVEETAEEITEEPAAEIEETAEEIVEEPQEEITEEPEEKFVPDTPPVIISEDNYREYAEVSIPVVSAEPVVIELPADEEPSEEITEEPSEEITEEPQEEFTEEPQEEITEEPEEAEEPEEEFVPEIPEVVEETVEAVPEEPAEEVFEEPQEEFAEEPQEEIAEEPEEEFIPEIPEVMEETVEEVPEEPAEEVFEEPQEEFTEEPQEEIAEEPEEETEEPEEKYIEEQTDVPDFLKTAEEIVEEEEPVVLSREDMGYDIVFNTTISCLITNAELTKSQANKLASILHDAYARAIKPVHGTLDGDTVFVLATGKQKVNFDAFAALATDVMQYAIIDGAMSAEGAYGLPAARDMR